MDSSSTSVALRRACEFFGSQSKLADCLGIRASFVSAWFNGDRPIPMQLAIAIERETAGDVTVEELRPDVDWAVIRRRTPAQGARSDGFRSPTNPVCTDAAKGDA
jgi:DNA-binding transcriptional regulator YdaS (Cro superfamily)